jgi:sucrose phosphorylase
MKNQVQLITYVDRLAGTLPQLQTLLRERLAGLFATVHLLPFFKPIDGADAGFDPIDHTAVDSRLGDWDDVQALARDVDLIADVIVNHVSSRSEQFCNFLVLGDASPYRNLFLTFDRVFPAGATESDLLAIYRPRAGLPFTPLTLEDGGRRLFWTTFTPEQIDIDVTDPAGVAYLNAILQTLRAAGVRIIRLDAVGYAIKKAGRSCFMMPETFEFIRQFSARARELGLEVLAEIHSYYRRQAEIAAHVDWVYDFALPPLVLHALLFNTATHLKRWLEVRPTNCLTVLDTHDGIGIIDVGADPADPEGHPGLVPPDELQSLVERIHVNSQGQSRMATGTAASNLDVYQVNCTYFDALGRSDTLYLIARAIQFFVPGVPQIYYIGLFAGTNDMELLARTGVGRDINRHHYTPVQIETALARPVVARLIDLIHLRNTHPAFNGDFQLLDTPPHSLGLEWRAGEHFARLHADLVNSTCQIECSTAGTGKLTQLTFGAPGSARKTR